MNLKNGIADEKVTAAFIAGAVSAFSVGTLGWLLPEVPQPPPGYESALTGILLVIAAWWKTNHGDYRS